MNLYVEKAQSEAVKNQAMLLSVPGFQSFVTTAAGISDVGVRALWADTVAGTERCFAVIGGNLYEIFSNQTVTKRGAVAQDANPATISYNGASGAQLFITSGGNGYYYALATNTGPVAITNLAGKATMGAFAHGYCLSFNINEGKVYESALNDASSWDPTQFFQRSLLADPWTAMFVDGNSLIWLPGTKTYEVWYDTGASPQPFAPLTGLVGAYGIAAPFAWGVTGSTIAWLTRNDQGAGQIAAFHGSAQFVSTYAVANAIDGYQSTSMITNAEMLLYQQGGHTFACASFPSSNHTWGFDIDQPSWHERGQWNSARGDFDLWSPRVHCYAFGKHLVGSRTSGTIAVMDASYATELDGTGIVRMRRTGGLTNELARQPYDRLELLMDVGVGLAGTGQGSDPQIMLRVSGDGGHTWGNQRTASLGRIGEYRRRVYWNRLGSLRDAAFELRVSDPVPVRIADAFLNNSAVGRAA